MSGPTILLDRTRPYGEYHGEGLGLRLYEQDGLPFDHKGELLMDLVTAEQKPLVEKKLKKAASKAKASAGDKAAAPAEADDEEGEDGSVINFDAWAQGKERHEWTVLAAEARKRFHKSFKGKDDLIEFLVFEAKMIALDDVATSLRPKG